jgi:hypothetical protein
MYCTLNVCGDNWILCSVKEFMLIKSSLLFRDMNENQIATFPAVYFSLKPFNLGTLKLVSEYLCFRYLDGNQISTLQGEMFDSLTKLEAV